MKKGKSIDRLKLISLSLTMFLMAMMGSVTAAPNFQVDIEELCWLCDIGLNTYVGFGGQEDTYNVYMVNHGTAGTMKVELGVYDRESVRNWYPSIVTPIANCKIYETNIATKSVYLEAGESVSIPFTVVNPAVGIGRMEATVHVQAFQNCWSSGVDIGQTSYDVEDIYLVFLYGAPDCQNGIMDSGNGETGTDCGGPCVGCPLDTGCDSHTDCLSGLYCENYICKEIPGTPDPPTTPGTPDPPTTPGTPGAVDCKSLFAGDPERLLDCYILQNVEYSCLDIYGSDNPSAVLGCLINQNKSVLNTILYLVLGAGAVLLILRIKG